MLDGEEGVPAKGVGFGDVRDGGGDGADEVVGVGADAALDGDAFVLELDGEAVCEFGDAALTAGVGDVVGCAVGSMEEHGEETEGGFGEVAEAAAGAAVAFENDRATAEDVADEVGEDATVVKAHAGTVGMKGADDAGGDVVLMGPGDAHGLAHTFAFAVAGADVGGIEEAAVMLGDGVGSVFDDAIDLTA